MYAQPILSHDCFNKGNLYEVVNITEFTIQVKVKDKIVTAKKNNFEISECLFGSEK